MVELRVRKAFLSVDLLKWFFSEVLGRVILPKNFHVYAAVDIILLRNFVV